VGAATAVEGAGGEIVKSGARSLSNASNACISRAHAGANVVRVFHAGLLRNAEMSYSGAFAKARIPRASASSRSPSANKLSYAARASSPATGPGEKKGGS